MRDSTFYADPGLKHVGHLCYCFDSKVGPGAPPLLKAPHSQSNLKSPQTLATAKNLTHLSSQLQCLRTCPLTQGYRKKPLFHTKRESGRDRDSNPGFLYSYTLLRRDNNARFCPRGKVHQVSLLEQGGGRLRAGDSDHRDHRDW
jgi:hypothetical protein